MIYEPIYRILPEIPQVSRLFTLKRVANNRIFNNEKPNLSFLTKRVYWCLLMNSLLQKLYTTNNPYKAFVAFSAYIYQVGRKLTHI